MGGINKLVNTSNDSPRSPHKHAKLKAEVIEFKNILLEAYVDSLAHSGVDAFPSCLANTLYPYSFVSFAKRHN